VDANPSDKGDLAYTASDALMELIGVEPHQQVITNQYGSRKPLTWRSFASVLHRGEGRITSEESIFSTDKYMTLSAFLTLFYDKDLSVYTEHEAPADIRQRNRAIRPVIEEMLADVSRQIEMYKADLARCEESPDDDLEQDIQRLQDLSGENERIRAELKDVATALTEWHRKRVAKELSLREYDDLASLYVGNIQRLSAIAEADAALRDIPEPERCPYCDSTMASGHDPEYAEAAHIESIDTAHNLKDLTEVRQATSTQLDAINERIRHLEAHQAQLETYLSGKLLPHLDKIKTAVTKFQDRDHILTRLADLEEQQQELQDRMAALPEDPEEPAGLFNPLELFPTEFYTEMTANLQWILKELHYSDAETARFHSTDFDIRVNNKPKRRHGKGYRALFNTVVLLALRKYISEHANHKPSVVVLDTPTLGLEHQDGGDLITSRDEQTGRPKTGLLRNLFDHMHDTGSYGQIIVLNNTDVTPVMHFDAEDSTELIFGNGPNAHRAGLLADIREDEADWDNEDGSEEEQNTLFSRDWSRDI